MTECERVGHEIVITKDGIGYCQRCDDWHDMDHVRTAAPARSSLPLTQPPAPVPPALDAAIVPAQDQV